MTQAVAMYSVFRGVTDAEVDALKAVTGKDATNEEFAVFLMAARKLGLDPFARQIQLIKFEGRPTHYTTIDGLRVIAGRSREYAGQVGPEWCGPDGKWRDVWLEEGPPAAARVGVLRRDFAEPLYAVARFKSYTKGNGTWSRYPDVMIAKVAESLALRRAFPNETSGLYSDGELSFAADAERELPPVRIVDEDTGEVTSAPIRALPASRPAPKPASKAQQADAVYSTGASLQKLRIRLREYGITTLTKADELSRELVGRDWEHVTEADAPAFGQWIAERDRVTAMLTDATEAEEAQAPA